MRKWAELPQHQYSIYHRLAKNYFLQYKGAALTIGKIVIGTATHFFSFSYRIATTLPVPI